MRLHFIIATLSLCPALLHSQQVTPQTRAYAKSESFPWSAKIPDDIRHQYIDTNKFIDEPSSPWRDRLRELIIPLIRDTKSAREAALLISSQFKELTGVDYSTNRRHPSMSPVETLESKRATCTGLSILYAAALRSVDIPSRLVGVRSWNHVPGNHTWTEVWLDGDWQMLELGEKNFNTPWVMEAVGMLDPSKPHQRVLAITSNKRPEKSQHPYFQIPWNRFNKSLEAEDVSQRYQRLARAWYKKEGLDDDNTQRLFINLLPPRKVDGVVKLVDADGRIIDSGALPGPTDDVRKLLTLKLPRDNTKSYYLLFPNDEKVRVEPTDAPTQVLRFHFQAK